MNATEIRDIITTLIINGFHLENIKRQVKECVNIYAFKYDKLGAKISYSFLFSRGSLNRIVFKSFLNYSEINKYTPILVSDDNLLNLCINYSFDDFYEKIGGYVNTGLILLENINDILLKLGHNELPNGLMGKPDELLEIYVKEIMQFLLISPVKRYGSDRKFESLPDGIILGKDLIIQFDSKAYANGFEFKADDIERFSKYINNFNKTYGNILGRVYSFIVVSGKINDSLESIESRKRALYKNCLTNLSCLDCQSFGEILKIIKEKPRIREAIDWKNIFSNTIITTDLVEHEINRINKDNII